MKELPKCHYRGPVTERGTYPCDSTKVIPSRYGVSEVDCRQCPYSDDPPPMNIPAQYTRKELCVHLGGDTGELVDCLTCEGTRLKVFSCEVFGKCTILKDGGIACCTVCESYEARA